MTNFISEDILALLIFLHKIITMPSGCSTKKKRTSSSTGVKCLKCFKPGHWTFQCPMVTGGNDGKKKQDWRKVGANIMTLSDLKKKEKTSGGSCRSGSCSMPSKSKSCSKGSCGPAKKKSYTGGGGCCSGSSKSAKPSKKSNGCSGGSCSIRGGYNCSSDSGSDDYSDDDDSDSETGSDFESDYSDSESGSESYARGGGGCRCGC